jgi:hypothetical protein
MNTLHSLVTWSSDRILPLSTNATSFSKLFVSLVNGFFHRCFLRNHRWTNVTEWFCSNCNSHLAFSTSVKFVIFMDDCSTNQWWPMVLGLKRRKIWSVYKRSVTICAVYHYWFCNNTFSNLYTLFCYTLYVIMSYSQYCFSLSSCCLVAVKRVVNSQKLNQSFHLLLGFPIFLVLLGVYASHLKDPVFLNSVFIVHEI